MTLEMEESLSYTIPAPPAGLEVPTSNSNGDGRSVGVISGTIDHNSMSNSNHVVLKRDLDNPYTPQHDSGHSSIESLEHQSSSSSTHSTSSCRNCGKVETTSSDQQQSQHYETIKLDELFTHVTSSPPSTSISSPGGGSGGGGSGAGSSLRKSILQNGFCSSCIQSKSKSKMTDSCSNSPSRTSSVESPSSGNNNSVIYKAEPAPMMYAKQEVYHDNNNDARLQSIMSSMISQNVETSAASAAMIPTSMMNSTGDTKMEVDIEGSGRCTVEVIPIPQELALQMMKTMPVSNANFGPFHIIDPSLASQFQQQNPSAIVVSGEQNAMFQNAQQQIIVGADGQHHMIIDGTPVQVYAPGTMTDASTFSTPTVSYSLETSEQTGDEPRSRKKRTFIVDPNKTYSTTDSITSTIDDVVYDSRQYALEQLSSGVPAFQIDNGEVAQTLKREVKIEISEDFFTNLTPTPPRPKITASKSTPTAATNTPSTGTIKKRKKSSNNNNKKSEDVKNVGLGPPPQIKFLDTPSTEMPKIKTEVPTPAAPKSSSKIVLAKKSAPPYIPLPPLNSVPVATAPSVTMYYTNTANKADKSVGCAACHKTFKNKRLCKAHYQRVHEKLKKYNCHICSAKFVYRGSLDSHLTSHKASAGRFNCVICSRTFKEKANLHQHLRVHQEGQRKFKCEFCSSSFSKRVNARYHMKRKHADLYPTSTMYLSTYGNSNNPNQPQQQHNMLPLSTSGVGPGGMMYGPPSTTTALPSYNPDMYSNMLQPNQPEAGTAAATNKKADGNFKCEYCGRGFLFKNNLKAHLRTHTRDKKYTCNQCEKGFIYKESLKNHMLLHSNSFPYTCEICHKSFRDRSNRRKHVKNVHKHMLVNGEIPSTYQGSSTSGAGTGAEGPKKRQRTRKPKKAAPSTSQTAGQDQYGSTSEFSTSQSNIKIENTSQKSGKKQGNKSLTNQANAINKSVIVSNNAPSSIDLDHGVIMSSGVIKSENSMEYNFMASNLPVTVHIPALNIPSSQSQQLLQQQQEDQQNAFGRNVIMKVSGAISGQDTQQHHQQGHPNEQQMYVHPGGAPMQQNVIVYPKPKASLLESYSSEVNQSVIAPNIQQYSYQQPTSYDANASGAAYSQLVPSSRLSPDNSSTPQTFVEANYLPSAIRGRSNSLTSSTLSHEANELLRGPVQYSTSISAPPVYSAEVPNHAGAPTNAPQYQQFWTQQVPVTNPSTQANTSTHAFYQQTVVSTPSTSGQILQGEGAPHAVTAPTYSTAETLPTNDQSSTNNYYKDFDFSYFMNPPNT